MHCLTPITLRRATSSAGKSFSHLLRREIIQHTAPLEALREAGKIGKVIKSVLQEDVETFALESLPVPGQGILTGHAPDCHVTFQEVIQKALHPLPKKSSARYRWES